MPEVFLWQIPRFLSFALGGAVVGSAAILPALAAALSFPRIGTVVVVVPGTLAVGPGRVPPVVELVPVPSISCLLPLIMA